MARRQQRSTVEDPKELGELLDEVSSLIERTKVMYEQYFMGIQKIPPAQLHRDVERKIRELTQRHIRNTALRYRLTTVTQKFGTYNTYWRRTMRQIEQGKYVRDVARAQRRALRRGEDVPDEILASMPKRMRDRVKRDRELLAKRTEREAGTGRADGSTDAATTVREAKPHALQLQMDDFDADIDALFANLTSEAEDAMSTYESPPAPPAAPPAAPPVKSTHEAPAPRTHDSRPLRASTPPPVPRPATPPPIPRAPRAKTPPPIPPAPPTRPAPTSAQPARAPGQPTRPRAAAAGVPPGMTEAKTKALYDRYIEARKRTGKSTDVRYEELVRSLNKQAPALMKKHKASGVEFDVQVRDGKVVLKATPKR